MYAGFDLRPDLVQGVVVPPLRLAHGSERPHATARAEPRAMGRGIAWRLARVQMTQAAEARAAAALKAEFRADIVHSLELELEARAAHAFSIGLSSASEPSQFWRDGSANSVRDNQRGPLPAGWRRCAA